MRRLLAPLSLLPRIVPRRRRLARVAGAGLVAMMFVVAAFNAQARWPGAQTNVRLELLMPPQNPIPFPSGATLLAAGSTPERLNQWGLKVRLFNASSGTEFFARADITVTETSSCWAAHGGRVDRTGDRTFSFTVPTGVCELRVEIRPAFPNFGLATFRVQVNLSTADEMEGLHSPAVKIRP
jgi:hypothetical protein